ncbi:MAG: helix-turn-helix domain-containing protein [Nostoc sp. LLA-1]|nr:helix-turn-helix domain-containing protein [Cyanocohniella sp. LLY]
MKLANKAQQEQLQEITQYLRQVRQDRSIRIEEIAARTNIQLCLLKALDAGQFEELPEPVYVQGFIRRYGDAVGLDGATLAHTFTINDFPPYATYNNSQNLDKTTTKYIPNFVPYVLLLALAAVGGIYVLNSKVITEFIAKKQNSVPTQAATTAPVTPTDEPLAQIQNSVSTPETTPLLIAPPQRPAKTNVEVSLELQGKSWLQVTVDDKTEFMGNLNKGAQRTWTAKEKLTVRSGNAGAVLISVNQQPAKPFGDDGDIKEVTFTTETYAQQ